MEVIEIKEEEFVDKVLNSEKKVLVDFFADWCGPCRMLGPVISEVAESDDNYFYYKINVDKAENISRKYGIMSIPALLVFENGEVTKSSLGYKNIEEVKEFLDI